MSENINFIPAAELPETESTDVEILCLENGELKRSANIIGGNGGAGTITGGGYVIHVPAEEMIVDEESGDTAIALSENYDNYVSILDAGGSIWLDISEMSLLQLQGVSFAIVPVNTALYSDDMGGFLMLASNPFHGGNITVMCPNGTWRPD